MALKFSKIIALCLASAALCGAQVPDRQFPLELTYPPLFLGSLNIGINTASPDATSLIQSVGQGSTQRFYFFDQYGSSPVISLRTALGTLASPTQVTTGTQIAAFQARGWTNAGAFTTARAAMVITAAENFTSTANGTILQLWATPTGAAAQSAYFQIDGSKGGCVEIANGVTSTCGTGGVFQTTGRIYMASLTAASGTPSSLCMNSGEVTLNAALTCTVSSRRFKTRIAPFAPRATPLLMKLAPMEFAYRDHAERMRWGFVAEYVAAVSHRLGDAYQPDGSAASLDQNAILALAVKTIQEQERRIERLEAELRHR